MCAPAQGLIFCFRTLLINFCSWLFSLGMNRTGHALYPWDTRVLCEFSSQSVLFPFWMVHNSSVRVTSLGMVHKSSLRVSLGMVHKSSIRLISLRMIHTFSYGLLPLDGPEELTQSVFLFSSFWMVPMSSVGVSPSVFFISTSSGSVLLISSL
ncbi:hypothetical protein FKM82_002690 [Ascaphus truei]